MGEIERCNRGNISIGGTAERGAVGMTHREDAALEPNEHYAHIRAAHPKGCAFLWGQI